MKQYPRCVTISYARCRGSTLIPLSLLYRDDADASVRRPHADGPRLDAVSRSVWRQVVQGLRSENQEEGRTNNLFMTRRDVQRSSAYSSLCRKSKDPSHETSRRLIMHWASQVERFQSTSGTQKFQRKQAFEVNKFV
jgi:hypothetical protein